MEYKSGASPMPHHDSQSFHVLIVDDDATILNLLREVLSMVPGCRFTTVSNPADAMTTIVKDHVDIIFTDIHMPGVTGLEMLKDIISLQRTPEVIVMTAYPSGEIANQAMELGATSLLAKPFEDIAMVELELEKAIKRILRQRSASKELPELKAKALANQSGEVDNDPPMKVSLDTPLRDPRAASEAKPSSPQSPAKPPAPVVAAMSPQPNPPTSVNLDPRKIYSLEMLEALIAIEAPRALRYNRPFAIGFVDIPESFQATLPSEQERYRKGQIEKIERCIRRSDVLLEAGREGMAVVLFECNRVGAEVVQHKLRTSGFLHTGFKVFPADAKNAEHLMSEARQSVQNKRKFQIALLEPEDFFGRIVQNMLLDPKYFVNWVRSREDAYKLISREAESLKLLLMSLTKDPNQWELLIRLKKENLIQWPVVLFIDIPLTKDLKNQLRQLGVRAVVNKGISQEEFIYIVQSFVLPRPQMDERKNFRALVAIPLTYNLEGAEHSSNSFTLSRDGIFIRDMNPPSSGAFLQMKLFIPGQTEPLEVNAEVIYTVPYFVGVNRFHVSGMAARFVGLDEAKKDLIEGFVSACLTSYLI